MEFSPDIVILDIGLRGIDSVAIARELRARARGDQTKLVAFTGWPLSAEDTTALRASFDYVFVKPAIDKLVDQLLA